MSDESELARLRADLKAMGRVEGLVYFGEDFKVRFNEKLKAIRDKIAKLEAEAEADPWREAKQFASAYRDPKGSSYLQKLIAHYDHLSAEVARLTERVAESTGKQEKPECSCRRGDMQRRIKMQRRELRQLNKKMAEYTALIAQKNDYVAGVANILIEAGVVSPPVRILRSQFGVLDRTYLFADDNEAQSHASPGDSSEHYRGQTN
jgi:hypothetical protein